MGEAVDEERERERERVCCSETRPLCCRQPSRSEWERAGGSGCV